MISPWWGVGVAVPAVALKLFSKDGKTKRDEEPSSRLDDDDATEPSFRCERVCTSDRLMRRMGGLSKASTLYKLLKNCKKVTPDSIHHDKTCMIYRKRTQIRV